ncbi:hypothetical protein PT2222_490010 [Paraburkholderia tropica]
MISPRNRRVGYLHRRRHVEARSGRRLGRCRRGAAPSRRLPARILGAGGIVRLQNECVRPFRRWLHSLGHHLDLRNGRGLKPWREFLFDAAKLVVKYEGSLSGERCDG